VAAAALAAAVGAIVAAAAGDLLRLLRPARWYCHPTDTQDHFLYSLAPPADVRNVLHWGHGREDGPILYTEALATLGATGRGPVDVIVEYFPQACLLPVAPSAPLPLPADLLGHVLSFCDVRLLLPVRLTSRACLLATCSLPDEEWVTRMAQRRYPGALWPVAAAIWRGHIGSVPDLSRSIALIEGLVHALALVDGLAGREEPANFAALAAVEAAIGTPPCPSCGSPSPVILPRDYVHFLLTCAGLTTPLYQAGSFQRRTACLTGASEYPTFASLRLVDLPALRRALADRQSAPLDGKAGPNPVVDPALWLPIGEEYLLCDLWLNSDVQSPSYGTVGATRRWTKEWMVLAHSFTAFICGVGEFLAGKSEGHLESQLSLCDHLSETFQHTWSGGPPADLHPDPHPAWARLQSRTWVPDAPVAPAPHVAVRPIPVPKGFDTWGMGARTLGMAWCGAVAEEPPSRS